MKRLNALLLLIVVAAFIGCDTHTAPTSADRGDAVAERDDVMLVRTRIAAEAAQMRAEADRLMALAQQSLSARKAAPRVLSPSGLIEVPGDYDTIQEAVDNAAPGDVIRVRGAFKEQGVINVFVEDITLDGTRAHLEGGPGARFQIFADDVRITGFTLKQMRIWVFGGDRVELTGNKVSHTGSGLAVLDGSRDCVVKSNHSHNNGHGLFLRDIEDCLIEKNTFSSNTNAGVILTQAVHNSTFLDNNLNGNRRGLRVFNSNDNEITDCTVNSSDLSGIILFESTGNVLTDCTANGNGFRGMLLLDSDDNEIHAGHANGNDDVGIELITSDNNTVEDSKAHGNKVCDAVDGGTGNVFSNNKFGSFNC